MSEAEFRNELSRDGLSPATIDDYCSYIAKYEESFGMAIDEIVQSDEKMAEVLGEMSRLKDVSPNSYSSYACGLRAYYFFRNKKKYRSGRNSNASSCPSSSSAIEDHWYKEVRVDDVEAWWQFVRLMNVANGDTIGDPRHWAFRGQGDAAWHLESSLGRLAGYGEGNQSEIGERLLRFERESMWIFSREASRHLEYRNLSRCNLLALMQHYGCQTRLLDFTMAPLIAVYMALESVGELVGTMKCYAAHHPGCVRGDVKRPGVAIWAINLDSFKSCRRGENRWESVENATQDAERILMPDSEPKLGVIPLFPTSCNDRISAQEGLFLMPCSLQNSFEENLREAIGNVTQKSSDLRTAEEEMRTGNQVSVYKFVFGSALHKNLNGLLLDANVTAKSIYPDLTGLGKFVSSEIRRHQDDAE